MSISHEEQQRIWDEEHAVPQVLLQMDSDQPSSGVVAFYEFLRTEPGVKTGVEMGCGKGRNVIWLAAQADMSKVHGLDFSKNAILEAKRRAGSETKAVFHVQDVTDRWPFEDASQDFVIDCFATTDIETPTARAKAVDESHRVLRPGGYLLSYVMSTDDEFHKEMLRVSPATERNAFIHPTTGKFEKVFDAEELESLHKEFILVESRRIEKTTKFGGKDYHCKHFWNVYCKS